jgi:hypothetical protein
MAADLEHSLGGEHGQRADKLQPAEFLGDCPHDIGLGEGRSAGKGRGRPEG